MKQVELPQLGLQRKQVLVYQTFLPDLVVSSPTVKSILVTHLEVLYHTTPKVSAQFILFVRMIPSVPPAYLCRGALGPETGRPIPVLVDIRLL